MESSATSPIFVGGLFKSGTSLLRAMLGQHSALASGLETYWFDMNWDDKGTCGKEREYAGRRWDASRDEPLAEQIGRLCKLFEIEPQLAETFVAQSASAEAFLERFLGHYATVRGKRRWVEKTPGNVLHLPRIFSAWPNAKVIHIIRDPKDVYASFKESHKWDTPTEFARLWCHFFKAVEQVKQQGGYGQNLLEIRYEQLVRDPQAATQAVCAFIEEPWEPTIAQYHGQNRDYQRIIAVAGKASATLERMRKPLTNERIGIWRTIVSDPELEAIREYIREEGCLDLFECLENAEVYATSGYLPAHTS